MSKDNRINIIDFILMEIERNYKNKLIDEKTFMVINKKICNDVIYEDKKFKDSAIIMTHIFKNLMIDFCNEVNKCVNKEGVYKNE